MTTPQDRLAAAHASWNAGDLDGYLELYDDAIRLHGYAPEPMGKAEVRGFYEAIFAAFGSPQLDFHEVLWDGDACTIRFTMTGRHVAEAAAATSHQPGQQGGQDAHRRTRSHGIRRDHHGWTGVGPDGAGHHARCIRAAINRRRGVH